MHLRKVPEMEVSIAKYVHTVVCDRSESVINAFPDDTYGLLELAGLIRTQVHSSSEIVDNTEDSHIPFPTFDNTRAKRRHARFLRPRENLTDLPG